MATFLQLCQKLARESGSVSGGAMQPTSVLNQSGRLAKVVAWLSDGWVELQDSRTDWLFLQKTFLNALSAGNMEYSGASFGLSDLGAWRETKDSFSIYDPAVGAGDEGFLKFADYDPFYRTYIMGAQQASRPIHYTVSPEGRLLVGPIPDKNYAMRGRYRRSPQVLAANTDVPIVSGQHDMLVWHALKTLHGSDEAPTAYQFDAVKFDIMWGNFTREYLPKMSFGTSGRAGSPLA